MTVTLSLFFCEKFPDVLVRNAVLNKLNQGEHQVSKGTGMNERWKTDNMSEMHVVDER